MYGKKIKKKIVVLLLTAVFVVGGCGQEQGGVGAGKEPGGAEGVTSQQGTELSQADGEGENDQNGDGQEEAEQKDYAAYFDQVKLTKGYKGFHDTNPIMTQRFGADPYAMVYGDRVYFYMTDDEFEYGADGKVQENTYGKIQSISVVSTADMVNFTDHGKIKVAGDKGAAKWAHNSWAPAATWKEVDGKPKFFLYFADNGGGIGVLAADSPVGPFRDELGKALVDRQTPNCSDVLWLFDPAVLSDDDGRAYLYFGGGVPEGKASHPGTGRAVELGEDMMSLKGDPVVIDAPYLFEDSGIHKVGDTYYYTYCSNWQVDEAGTAEYGFYSAEIVSMESKNPLGPFQVKETILQNPGRFFGLYGNNHHCVFAFQDRWYITYHTRVLEKAMGVEHGYRCTHVEEFAMGEDGTIGQVMQKLKGREQLMPVNPYENVNGATAAMIMGADTVAADETSKMYGCGKMALGDIDSGDYVELQGVEFGEASPEEFVASVRCEAGGGVIRVTADNLKGDVLAYLPVEPDTGEFAECRVKLERKVTGLHDLYFVFYGEGYEIESWRFE